MQDKSFSYIYSFQFLVVPLYLEMCELFNRDILYKHELNLRLIPLLHWMDCADTFVFCFS